MTKVCLLTSAQPSINPRLVKEADALSEAGYEVQVICAHCISWADEADEALLSSRKWSYLYVGGYPARHCVRYWWTRLRHGLAKKALLRNIKHPLLLRLAPARVMPELMRAAKAIKADLYIAHNLAALPPAVDAARKHGAKVGFDAEDFHSGMDEGKQMTALIECIERQYLPLCDYHTAGSPQIAEAYTVKYQIPSPTPVLNVFPLAERPPKVQSLKPNSPLTLYWFSQTIGVKRGLEDVVKAMGLLPECDIQLNLRGNWQQGYKGQLLKLASEVGLDPDWIVGHRPRPAEEMVRLAATYNVGLALEPHTRENNELCLSNKLYTYLLAGNAVIATATRAQRAMIEAIGEAGFCYESGDIEALAAQLKHWYDDREALEKARRQAWEWGTKRYNWDLEKSRFLKIIEDVLARPRAAR